MPVENRLCSTCDKVEDEEHFLISCKTNQDERQIVFKSIENECRNFTRMSTNEKMVYMMMNPDEKITQDTAMFILNSFKKLNYW